MDDKIDRDDNIWDQVTIIRGKVAAAEKKRDGRMTAVEKRGGQASAHSIAMAKLDNADDVVKLNTNTKEFGKLVSQARTERGLTRKQLAKQLNMDIKDLSDIENGTGKYKGEYVGKCKRVLKVGLKTKKK